MQAMKLFALIGIACVFGCGGGGGGSSTGGQNTPLPITVKISPANPTVLAGVNRNFTAAVTGTTNTAVTWIIQEGAAGGTITAGGVYSCNTPGIYHIIATSQVNIADTDTTTVTVQGGNVNGSIQ